MEKVVLGFKIVNCQVKGQIRFHKFEPFESVFYIFIVNKSYL